ncbi:MAG: SdpI family protein [Methanomicrobiales archaeon]|nr:SdpI family protein [Methanomicrobiales archaeon]
MHLPKNRMIIAGILLLTFAVAFIAYPSMPDPMATHWGLSGKADGYLPRIWGLFLVPLISTGLAFLLLLIPRIDPLKENIERFRETYEYFIAILLLFLLYVSLLVIAWNLGVRFNIAQVLSPAFGVLLYACGVLVGKAKRNWFIGIRTPWTLSSDRVWDRTHAVGGRLFKIAGILALLGALFPGIVWLLILGPVFLISICLVVYSYLEYRKDEGRVPKA